VLSERDGHQSLAAMSSARRWVYLFNMVRFSWLVIAATSLFQSLFKKPAGCLVAQVVKAQILNPCPFAYPIKCLCDIMTGDQLPDPAIDSSG